MKSKIFMKRWILLKNLSIIRVISAIIIAVEPKIHKIFTKIGIH